MGKAIQYATVFSSALFATTSLCGCANGPAATGGVSGNSGQSAQDGGRDGSGGNTQPGSGGVTSGGATSGGSTSTSAGGSTVSSSNGGSGNADASGNLGSAGNAVTTPGPLNPTTCAMPGGAAIGTVTGTPGVWQDVTPKELSLDGSLFNGDNFGVQDVLVDPVRPSDVYTFACHQGVWKSTDYGATWKKINTGNQGSAIDGGKPWGSGIDSNRCRDPKTPPTLYTLNGNGQQGFWRSTDGGVSWNRTELPKGTGLPYPQDAYSIGVDPYDGKHILMGFHEAKGLIESNDGGLTWVVHTPADGTSNFYTFLDTGDAASTRSTWLSLSQSGNTYRTKDSAATWTQVETVTHAHGCSQIFQAGKGVIYMPGLGGTAGNGVYRSDDIGLTWKRVYDGNENNVIGTDSTLYASYGWPGGNIPANLQTAARGSGTPWTGMTVPSGMQNGAKGSAVTSDGKTHVVISGNWQAGIWRYVEM